ncbi:MAG: sensor protein, partial [Bacteroidetes bacterium]|nr:sensor protein [Bacteroidota bacterium]
VEALGIVWDAHWLPVSEDLYMHYAFDITERKLAEKASKRAEEALRASEAKYRDLIERAWDAIFVADRYGTILLANTKACELLGCEREEALKMNIADTYLAEEREVVGERIARAEKGEHWRYERAFVRKDGAVLPVEVTIGSLPDGTIQGIMRDITERRQAEGEIKRKTEDLFLLDSLNAAANRGDSIQSIIQLLVKESKSIFSCQGATIYLLSEDKKYLIMQNLPLPPASIEWIEKLIGTKIPPIRIALKEDSLYRRVWLEGKPMLTNDPEIIQAMMSEFTESEVLKKLVPVIFSFLEVRSVITAPIIAGDGLIGIIDISRKVPFAESDSTRMQAIAEEVSAILQRKRAEETLKESEDRYRDLVANSSDLICTHDLDGNILSVNNAGLRISGYSEDETLKMNMQDLIVPEYRRLFKAYLVPSEKQKVL